MIFAAPRCSEIPELGAIRDIFEKKYGKDFVSAATDLRPNSGVNRMVFKDFQLFRICWDTFRYTFIKSGVLINVTMFK